MNKPYSALRGLTASMRAFLQWSGLIALAIVALCATSCDPEAKWETKEVEINITVKTISAGFVECDFSTTKEAYYLIAIQPVDTTINPMTQQKQFMMLALDSANVKYLAWRHEQLTKGEFNVAPFASHALQYGSVEHAFTGLWPSTEYWIYAFVVNPETMEPAGKLYLKTICTKDESSIPICFEYRVKGNWDYIYPIDSLTNTISAHFPYVATTCDSAIMEEEMADPESLLYGAHTPQEYFNLWLLYQSLHPEQARVLYGVSAIENDGVSSHLCFEEGHTYYTFIGGYDFSSQQNTLYKFKWEGEKTNLYFTSKDNIAWDDDE